MTVKFEISSDMSTYEISRAVKEIADAQGRHWRMYDGRDVERMRNELATLSLQGNTQRARMKKA